MDTIDITYEITIRADEDIRTICREIALEQTVELPDELVQSAFIRKSIIGKVQSINQVNEKPHLYSVIIAYNPEISGHNIPQLLNLLYGNISLKNNIKIVNVAFPDSFLEHFFGPAYGISGIRQLTGIWGRPLFSTALKPMGLEPKEFAAIAKSFALGGGDIIKDDHGLDNQSFSNFYERVARCQDAVSTVYAKTGQKTLYFPNICVNFEEIERTLDYAKRLSVEGVLVSPFLMGADIMRYISKQYGFIIMAHPALTGTFFSYSAHGISATVLLGTLFRLFGADISVYPNTGGRFGFTLDECKEINARLTTKPLGKLKGAFGAPAGGMSIDNIEDMAKHYGPDVVYLIGGALHGYDTNIEKSTKVFMEKIALYFNEYKTTPTDKQFVSACEIGHSSSKLLEYMKFNNTNCMWSGRQPVLYKTDSNIDFSKITRHELTGKNGESTSFDLRYFQIEPNGYSSFEKHVHEHVIICLKGEGMLKCGQNTYTLNPYDIAYVPPSTPHQLKNTSNETFGFFCIVDHVRDQPEKGL
nr:RuBisCO [Candidatus Magnetoovum sp.]